MRACRCGKQRGPGPPAGSPKHHLPDKDRTACHNQATEELLWIVRCPPGPRKVRTCRRPVRPWVPRVLELLEWTYVHLMWAVYTGLCAQVWPAGAQSLEGSEGIQRCALTLGRGASPNPNPKPERRPRAEPTWDPSPRPYFGEPGCAQAVLNFVPCAWGQDGPLKKTVSRRLREDHRSVGTTGQSPGVTTTNLETCAVQAGQEGRGSEGELLRGWPAGAPCQGQRGSDRTGGSQC